MTEIPAIELVSSTEQVFLEQLIDGHAVVAGDIVQIASDSWVIHGLVHDGEDVTMAKFLDRERPSLKSPVPTLNSVDRFNPK